MNKIDYMQSRGLQSGGQQNSHTNKQLGKSIILSHVEAVLGTGEAVAWEHQTSLDKRQLFKLAVEGRVGIPPEAGRYTPGLGNSVDETAESIVMVNLRYGWGTR